MREIHRVFHLVLTLIIHVNRKYELLLLLLRFALDFQGFPHKLFRRALTFPALLSIPISLWWSPLFKTSSFGRLGSVLGSLTTQLRYRWLMIHGQLPNRLPWMSCQSAGKKLSWRRVVDGVNSHALELQLADEISILDVSLSSEIAELGHLFTARAANCNCYRKVHCFVRAKDVWLEKKLK